MFAICLLLSFVVCCFSFVQKKVIHEHCKDGKNSELEGYVHAGSKQAERQEGSSHGQSW